VCLARVRRLPLSRPSVIIETRSCAEEDSGVVDSHLSLLATLFDGREGVKYTVAAAVVTLNDNQVVNEIQGKDQKATSHGGGNE
jgi:hypothetical protein